MPIPTVFIDCQLSFINILQLTGNPDRGSFPGYHPDRFLLFLDNAWHLRPGVTLAASIGILIPATLLTGFALARGRRKRVEAALRTSERRYRQVLDSQRDMVCRYRPDSTLTFVNESYCRFFGKSREELLGNSFYMLIPESSHAEVAAILQRLLENKQTLVQEHQVRRTDGVIRWVQWEDYPIIGENGQIDELQSIGRDVTQRWQALEALRQSEERFSGIFRGSPTAISIIRQRDGHLLEVNPSWEKFFEIDRETAIRVHPAELGIFDGPAHDRGFRSFLESGKSLRGYEQRVLTPSGKSRWMSVSCELAPLNGEACYIVMSKDITGQKEVEDARHSLIQATKLAMLGELTASIAHEVNQPLGAILSNADTAEILLRRESPPLPEIRQILSDIRRDDLRASEIIKRVRAIVTKHEVQMSPLNLNEVLRDVEDLITHDIQRKGVRIIRELAVPLPDLIGDRIQIEQVLLNLLLNALDALAGTPVSQRWIVIRSAMHDALSVEATIEDSGPGIDEDVLAKIFDSFFTTKNSGMGLGLALSRSIAEAHGGQLIAGNNSHGGATLRLILPIPNPS